jgi:hypothetical protein
MIYSTAYQASQMLAFLIDTKPAKRKEHYQNPWGHSRAVQNIRPSMKRVVPVV